MKYSKAIGYQESLEVAPLVGARIEMAINYRLDTIILSLPSRERGLKFGIRLVCCRPADVAPLAGAWIEIWYTASLLQTCRRRSPRGSVD